MDPTQDPSAQGAGIQWSSGAASPGDAAGHSSGNAGGGGPSAGTPSKPPAVSAPPVASHPVANALSQADSAGYKAGLSAPPIPNLARQYGSQAPVGPVFQLGAGYHDPNEREQVKILQGQLARSGHDPKGIDGLFGKYTEQAVSAYRDKHNLGPGKVVDQTMISHLNLNFPAGKTPSPPPRPGATPAGIPPAAPSAGVATPGLWNNMTPAEQAYAEAHYGGGVSLTNPQPSPPAAPATPARATPVELMREANRQGAADQRDIEASRAAPAGAMTASDHAAAISKIVAPYRINRGAIQPGIGAPGFGATVGDQSYVPGAAPVGPAPAPASPASREFTATPPPTGGTPELSKVLQQAGAANVAANAGLTRENPVGSPGFKFSGGVAPSAADRALGGPTPGAPAFAPAPAAAAAPGASPNTEAAYAQGGPTRPPATPVPSDSYATKPPAKPPMTRGVGGPPPVAPRAAPPAQGAAAAPPVAPTATPALGMAAPPTPPANALAAAGGQAGVGAIPAAPAAGPLVNAAGKAYEGASSNAVPAGATPAIAFIASRGAGINTDHLDVAFANRLSAAVAAGEAATGAKGEFVSVYRTKAQQAAAYHRYVASGFNPAYIAARPGLSQHELGRAADMKAGPVRDWVEAHAQQFGLEGATAADRAHHNFRVDAAHLQMAGGKTPYDGGVGLPTGARSQVAGGPSAPAAGRAAPSGSEGTPANAGGVSQALQQAAVAGGGGPSAEIGGMPPRPGAGFVQGFPQLAGLLEPGAAAGPTPPPPPPAKTPASMTYRAVAGGSPAENYAALAPPQSPELQRPAPGATEMRPPLQVFAPPPAAAPPAAPPIGPAPSPADHAMDMLGLPRLERGGKDYQSRVPGGAELSVGANVPPEMFVPEKKPARTSEAGGAQPIQVASAAPGAPTAGEDSGGPLMDLSVDAAKAAPTPDAVKRGLVGPGDPRGGGWPLGSDQYGGNKPYRDDFYAPGQKYTPDEGWKYDFNKAAPGRAESGGPVASAAPPISDAARATPADYVPGVNTMEQAVEEAAQPAASVRTKSGPGGIPKISAPSLGPVNKEQTDQGIIRKAPPITPPISDAAHQAALTQLKQTFASATPDQQKQVVEHVVVMGDLANKVASARSPDEKTKAWNAGLDQLAARKLISPDERNQHYDKPDDAMVGQALAVSEALRELKMAA